ncbi:MAG: hypothetical protein KDK70_03010 [Myxococcales bacterium]|nr:hypothetical protein [Myxococcales bacterium]
MTCKTLARRMLAMALGVSLAAAPGPTLAQDADPASMSDDQKLERAKVLYGEGVAALEGGDAALALVKFEQAYDDFAPDLHTFNFNIGVAAQQVGDCIKAKRAFERFLDLVPKHKARKEVQQRLLEIERSGCVAEQQARIEEEERQKAAAATVEPSQTGDNFDAPELGKRKPGDGEEPPTDAGPERTRPRGLLVAGAVLAGVGGAALIGGAVSLGVASRRAHELAALSSPGATGFPAGDYRDEEVSGLDRRGLPAANAASVGLLVGGGVLAAVGVTLIVIDRTGKGRAGSDPNARGGGPRLTGLGPSLVRGGAGAAATLRF